MFPLSGHVFVKMPLRSHLSVLKEYKGSYGAYYIQDLSKQFSIMYSNSFLAAAAKISSQKTIVNLAKRAFSNVLESVTSKRFSDPLPFPFFNSMPVKRDYSGK